MNNIDDQTQFDVEADVNLSMEQLSFVCKHCGKVNPITAGNCVRCGKRRPRDEYVKAMERLQNSKTVRAQFLEQQAKAENERNELAQQQLVRIVESRVADEKTQILAQEEVRLEQERDEIKRLTARDAVLRVVAAENAAEERVVAAERKADDAIMGRNREIEDLVEAEREKALNAAAEKLIAERAAIEQVAREKVEANRRIAEKQAYDTVSDAKDAADKAAARQAVLQIIAAENAADEKIRLSKSALQQAAVERIVEERVLADKEASARYAAEKQAIERAADERIKAEREAVRRLLEERGQSVPQTATYGGAYGQASQAQQVQPFAIVPYLNANQPLYQYNPNRTVYRFIPDATAPQMHEEPHYAQMESRETYDEYSGKKPKKEKKMTKTGINNAVKVRICAAISLVLMLAVLAFSFLLEIINKNMGTVLPILSQQTGTYFFRGTNLDILKTCGVFLITGINAIFKADLSIPVNLKVNTFYSNMQYINYDLSILITIGFVLFVFFALIVLIQSVVRLCTGKGTRAGFVFPLIMLVGLIVSSIGILLTLNFIKAPVGKMLPTVGLIVFAVIAVVNLDVMIVGGTKKKKQL